MSGFVTDAPPWRGGRVGDALCVLAGNTGPMTLTGTNTWIVPSRDARRCLVVDPSPSGAHVERVQAACAEAGWSIAAIAVTHHHWDHSDGVRQLALATGAPWFAPSDELLRRWSVGESCGKGTFVEAERRGELERGGNMPDGSFAPFDDAPAMRIVSLPGHSKDSVGILLEDESALITGDVVFRHAPTVVSHPDGQLGPYLDTLDTLERLAESGAARIFLPGHGYPIDDPLGIVAATREHRLARLAAIRRALGEGTPADPGALFDAVYTGVRPELREAASRSIEAQLAYLALGKSL